jgi:hypothetical protein
VRCSSQPVGWWNHLRLATGAWQSCCGRHSHPPRPLGAPRRALFPRRRWRDALFEGPLQSSFQACLYVVPWGWAGWFPTARLDEHRLYKCSFQARSLPSRNGTHVVPTAPVEGAPPAICKSELVPRARSGSTGTICVSFPPLLACVFGEQRKPPSLPIFPFAEPSAARRAVSPLAGAVVPRPAACSFTGTNQATSPFPTFTKSSCRDGCRCPSTLRQ